MSLTPEEIGDLGKDKIIQIRIKISSQGGCSSVATKVTSKPTKGFNLWKGCDVIVDDNSSYSSLFYENRDVAIKKDGSGLEKTRTPSHVSSTPGLGTSSSIRAFCLIENGEECFKYLMHHIRLDVNRHIDKLRGIVNSLERSINEGIVIDKSFNTRNI